MFVVAAEQTPAPARQLGRYSRVELSPGRKKSLGRKGTDVGSAAAMVVGSAATEVARVARARSWCAGCQWVRRRREG